MKRSNCRLYWLFSLAMILAFVACSKEGSQGPAGPAGPQGPQGPAGPAGTDAAGITYSAWEPLAFDSIRDNNGVATKTGFFAIIDAPKLTDDILNKGLVNVYFNFDSTSKPYIVPVPYVDNNMYITYQAEKGSIYIVSNVDLSGGSIHTGDSPINLFRYVLVPGATAARSANGVDWKNYASVKKFYGLKD
ncbi:collagen-like protein [Chitinophaga polysaccharea]|uniref:collagen-like protein n=2 Tax=Chitinophaga TaxID=79328 RepID=UPI001455B95C|nr:collagen-like protein [Chitinophaga polysaccharea]NLR61356.1 collagen-like protein [Chitinophaga polysaccharea]